MPLNQLTLCRTQSIQRLSNLPTYHAQLHLLQRTLVRKLHFLSRLLVYRYFRLIPSPFLHPTPLPIDCSLRTQHSKHLARDAHFGTIGARSLPNRHIRNLLALFAPVDRVVAGWRREGMGGGKGFFSRLTADPGAARAAVRRRTTRGKTSWQFHPPRRALSPRAGSQCFLSYFLYASGCASYPPCQETFRA
jgi:hypothetical protein